MGPYEFEFTSKGREILENLRIPRRISIEELLGREPLRRGFFGRKAFFFHRTNSYWMPEGVTLTYECTANEGNSLLLSDFYCTLLRVGEVITPPLPKVGERVGLEITVAGEHHSCQSIFSQEPYAMLGRVVVPRDMVQQKDYELAPSVREAISRTPIDMSVTML